MAAGEFVRRWETVRSATIWLMACVLAVASTAGCALARRLTAPGEVSKLDRKSRYLKAHMRNGELYVLDAWRVDEGARLVLGTGTRYDQNRDPIGHGPHSVPIGEVALFETNAEAPREPLVAGLTIVSVLSLTLTAICIASPKSCFGSCPTFYLDEAAGSPGIAAEAFSASVAPALEADDVDALYRARPAGRDLRLRLTNEALETHVIRRADLLVAPRPAGGRVLAAGDGRFWQARALVAPVSCRAAEGDCLQAVSALDERERSSTSDPDDLSTRETIDLVFPATGVGSPRALVVEARQTFITTFLFYQALAYMGRQAGTYLAALERGDGALKDRATRLHHLLGDIEVQAPDGRGGWMRVGGFEETGPIASDLQMVPLPAGVPADRLRLRLTRGHWRLGHLALATLGSPVEPRRIRPAALETRRGDAAAAADWLAGRRPALVTGPGDEHQLRYLLPEDPENLELFLDSRGYYLEWMREPWLAEESVWRLGRLLDRPAQALRDLAPAYKKVEPQIEELFWRSRYVHPAAR